MSKERPPVFSKIDRTPLPSAAEQLKKIDQIYGGDEERERIQAKLAEAERRAKLTQSEREAEDARRRQEQDNKAAAERTRQDQLAAEKRAAEDAKRREK